MEMNWTDERVELLRKLWSDGLSASQIAAQLGNVSRNAVIGKVHRLKLSGRGRSTAAAPRAKKTTQTTVARATKTVTTSRVATTTTIGATALKISFDTEVVARQQIRPVENVVVPIQRKLQLVELTERTCKWPNGDPLTESFNFCGADSAETGPYCQFHSRIAFQPASERRRVR
jgi:GcrA cell cycle regulator